MITNVHWLIVVGLVCGVCGMILALVSIRMSLKRRRRRESL